MTAGRAVRLPDIAGMSGLYLFAFSLWLSTAGAYIGLGLLLLASLVDRATRSILLRDPMIRLALLFAGLLLLHALWAAWNTAENLAVLWGDAWKWLRLFLFFLFVAWWLAGDEARIERALLLALAGFLLKILLGIQATGWSILWSGERSGFGLPVNTFGLFCATALLGLLVLAPRLWRTPKLSRYNIAVRVLAWCLAVAAVFQGFITAQSRDAWIAALIVFPLILSLRLTASMRRADGSSWLRAGAILILITALIGAITARNLDTITERAHHERSAWQALLAGEFDKIPAGSIGHRIQLVEYGLQKWLERPFIGWGTHSYRELITQTDDAALRRMPHLHNIYIETLLTFGILGAAFFLFLMGRLCAIIYQSWRTGRMSMDIALFLSGALGLQFIWCLASFGINQVTWNFYFAMLAGTIYSYRIRTRGEQAMGNPSI
jgi:O-antigen ligase